MQIKKEYKFYAGHRNQDLKDKCHRVHGHMYFLTVFFNVKRTGSITTLFSNFDDVLEPWIKTEIDHRCFLDVNDPLYQTFVHHLERTGEDLGPCLLPFPSSVENVSLFIFFNLTVKYGFDVEKIELKETSSSTIIYDKKDYISDMSIKTNLGIKLYAS